MRPMVSCPLSAADVQAWQQRWGQWESALDGYPVAPLLEAWWRAPDAAQARAALRLLQQLATRWLSLLEADLAAMAATPSVTLTGIRLRMLDTRQALVQLLAHLPATAAPQAEAHTSPA